MATGRASTACCIQFSDRWRDAGHLSEKAFAELQPLWKEAIHTAAAPLEALQKQSLERRHAMIDEARELGAQPQLRIDAVKALQQRWQAEAQGVPLDRKHEQKLWDAFRKPIDEAFNRKNRRAREEPRRTLSQRDRIVLDASKALEAANATGDAQKIRAAMSALGSGVARPGAGGEAVARATKPQEAGRRCGSAAVGARAPEGTESVSEAVAGETPAAGEAELRRWRAAAAAPAGPAPEAVAQARDRDAGDDRPGMKKAEPMAPGRGGKFGDRKVAGAGRRTFGETAPRRPRPARRSGRFGDRRRSRTVGPRLGDVAFRAQREALEHAQSALKKLGGAGPRRSADAADDGVGAALRRAGAEPAGDRQGRGGAGAHSWVQAVQRGAQGRSVRGAAALEIAAESPTPAEHLSARRLLQLQLLTRRNDPSPEQTWGQDAAKVLATAYDAGGRAPAAERAEGAAAPLGAGS
jgi:hypothetical protein